MALEIQREYQRLRRLAGLIAPVSAAKNTEYSRRWLAKHPGYHIRWAAANKPSLAAASARWRKAHPDRHCARSARYRARKNAARMGSVQAIAEFYSWLRDTSIVICHWCRYPVPQHSRRADHFVPLAKGGAHSVDNLVPACDNCNARKKDKLPEEFLLTTRAARAHILLLVDVRA